MTAKAQARDRDGERLQRLVASLARDAADADTRVVETHISLLLLTGDRVYKFKKPVDLGFVDFTSAERRRHFCEEELRLNRRLAPELYLEVVAFGGDPDKPRANASPVLDWAVMMRRFPADAQLDHVVAADGAPACAFAALGRDVAAFHAAAERLPAESDFGSPRQVGADCEDNFDALRAGAAETDVGDTLDPLRRWTRRELARLAPALERRRRAGRVRECHGDMHLSNMVWLDEHIRVFDCIEFSEPLRWIDVSNEIAFLMMDLDERGRSDLGRVFLDAWLQASGDWEALLPLRLFRAYRSMVRAKVAALRAQQAEDQAERSTAARRLQRHLALAQRYARPPPRPVLVITRGLSGSGKTTVTEALLPVSGDAVRLRSDVERKRLHGLSADARSGSAPDAGLYTAQSNDETYEHLLKSARTALGAGHHTIVDATFAERHWRDRFAGLARSLGCRFVLLDCVAPPDVLRERVRARTRDGRDASEAGLAVLERQLARAEAPHADEQPHTLTLDTRERADPRDLARRLGVADEARAPARQGPSQGD